MLLSIPIGAITPRFPLAGRSPRGQRYGASFFPSPAIGRSPTWPRPQTGASRGRLKGAAWGGSSSRISLKASQETPGDSLAQSGRGLPQNLTALASGLIDATAARIAVRTALR